MNKAVLYLGPYSGTSKHRADAFGRLGYSVEVIDPTSFVPQGNLLAKIHFESGGILCEKIITDKVLNAIRGKNFDLTWVNSGRYVGPSLIKELQSFGPIVNYNNDDPLGDRDRLTWSLYKKSIPFYDLLVYHREINVNEAYALGAKRVIWVYSVIDEVAHAVREISPQDYEKWHSEVLFMGTWMPERGPFMRELVTRNVPLTIYGNRWDKAPEWQLLMKYWKGPATTDYTDYAKAIQSSKICLGLLSKGNRDLHTRRSIEVPALGGLLCAERTSDHEQLYVDGEEAVFWSDAAECAQLCVSLLKDETRRHQIAQSGQKRCFSNGNYNEAFLRRAIDLVMRDTVND